MSAARRLSGRPLRTPAVSLNEYSGRWTDAAERWRLLSGGPAANSELLAGHADLNRAVMSSSYGTATLHALMDSVPYTVAAPAFFRWRADKLAAIFRAHYEPTTPITEIGCGVGKNLLALALAGYSELAGYDPLDVAVAAVTAQARHLGLDIGTGRFDLLEPDPGTVCRLRGRVLFTNHVLEQLPRHLPAALGCMLGAAPREVVHIEPCVEPLRPCRSPTDLATLLHTYASDYQRTLLCELTALHQREQIEILEVTALGYAPRPRSSPTLIRWRPRT
jgi:hypothetical protein